MRKEYSNMGVKARGPHGSSWNEVVPWWSVRCSGLSEPWYAIRWVDS